ncbi:UDP-glucoronosyl and UDP-glucosyl transferase [Trichostrongylus colubriformis]|uniref:glucuronosyltransferase n=1 Tax=Trichostrongylus colubriformis TaxID=6319 RepID=A0AAN8IGA9_TRICO
MIPYWVLLLTVSLYSTDAYKFLVYSPIYGYSHTNFMGALADTLTEAGHDVTVLMPILDEEQQNKTALKLTTKVIKIPPPPSNHHMKQYKEEAFAKMWTMEPSVFGMIQELIADTSYAFTNSNPYLDYPRPMLQKTIPIGGIAVALDPKNNVLSKDWDSILGLRNTTVLVSFGSMAKSMSMPDEYKKTLLKVFESMPETTFIWKYEEKGSKFAAHLKNVHLSTWVPQNALLADPRLTVFVTHGGLGSTTELAHMGKPSLLVPLFADQTRNANMLAKHGGGIVLKKDDLGNSEKLTVSLKRLLNDASYSRNAKRLADMLLNQPISAKELFIKHCEFAAK